MEALYELAERYEVELFFEQISPYRTFTRVRVGGAEVDYTMCRGKTVRGCIEGILHYIREEWPARVEEERRRAIKAEVKTAVERWYVQCFHFLPFRDVKEVIARLEEYALMCEVMKTARREFGGEIYIEEEVRRAFWWDGEWEGREISCFVTSHKALCRVGDAVWKFAVWSTPEGVYIKPDSHLYSQWTRVAARGGE